MTRAEPQAAASAFEFERPGRCASPIGARRRQKRERRQRGCAGERGDQDQAEGRAPEPAVERRGQRADAQDERKRERDRAVGADAAVAHDLELHRPRRAAAETVGDIGEPVLMQRAGQGDERRRRQRSAKEQGQAEQRRQREDERADETDSGAGDRRRPGDAAQVERRSRPRPADAEAGEKAQRVGDVARGGREPAGAARAHQAPLSWPKGI